MLYIFYDGEKQAGKGLHRVGAPGQWTPRSHPAWRDELEKFKKD